MLTCCMITSSYVSVTLIIINSNKVLVVIFYVQSVIIIIPFTCLTVLGVGGVGGGGGGGGLGECARFFSNKNYFSKKPQCQWPTYFCTFYFLLTNHITPNISPDHLLNHIFNCLHFKYKSLVFTSSSVGIEPPFSFTLALDPMFPRLYSSYSSI